MIKAAYRGFKTKQAAEDFVMTISAEPAYCSLHPAFRGVIFVSDPIQRAGGRIYTFRYKNKCKDGKYRNFYAAYIGA